MNNEIIRINKTSVDFHSLSIEQNVDNEKIKEYQEKTKEYLNKLDNIIKSRRDLAKTQNNFFSSRKQVRTVQNSPLNKPITEQSAQFKFKEYFQKSSIVSPIKIQQVINSSKPIN